MTTNVSPSASEEIRLGMANACLMMPAETGKRREELVRLHHLADEEREAVKEAKESSGYAEHKTRMAKVYGVTKVTLQIMKLLDGVKKPGDRAAVLTQVGLLSQDVGYLDKDLVSLAQDAAASAGQQSADQGSVFDKTSEGQRRGGEQAQPKPVKAKAADLPPHKPTPGIPLQEAQAQLEAYLKANPPKPGRRPAERVRLEKQVEAAKAADAEPAEAGAEHPAQDAEPLQDDPDPLAQKPEAEPGAVGQEMREGAAESDAFLRQQSEKHSASGAGPAADPKAPAAELEDELPPPAPRRRAAPLPGASGQGSYTLN